jgi:hypothetical protein
MLPLTIEEVMERVTQVLGEMKAIGDLDCLGCTVSDTVSIGSRSITRHDLHARMRSQPGCQRLGVPIREQIDPTPPLEIHENRAVATSPAKGKVIDTEDAGSLVFGE